MMMADSEIDTSAAVMLTTNSKILVTVDEALQDVIVVSYTLESRLFQGVLLDSTKRFLPCRINENVLGQMKSPSERSEEDKLFFSIRQRFTYFEEKPLNNFIHKKIKSKSQKMTVRLRPRQVLCSKCKSICNENSENVNSHMTRRKAAPVESSSSAQTSKPLCSGNRSNSVNGSPQKLCPSFIPKIPCKRLKTEVLSTNCDINGEDKIEEDFWFKNEENKDEEDDKQMVLRKKRSVGSMEDLWDETVFEEGSKKAKTTPVIKISFGSQGEGTVLKIPPKVQDVSEEEKVEETTKSNKKAKKSKKEAKRKPEQDQKEDQSRKHKHKAKHKKKHKSERYEEELKEKCLKQNLSIHLKRISSTAYEKKSDSEDESSRSSDEIPDFPSGNPIDGSDVLESYKTDNGTVLTAGDIVWGKIEGFPWWPGKVLNISANSDKNSSAHISWYGTPTPVSSMMPCDQLSPFLQSFEVRFNKKRKSTGYKEAIRLATTDASVNNPDVQIPEILSVKPVEV